MCVKTSECVFASYNTKRWGNASGKTKNYLLGIEDNSERVCQGNQRQGELLREITLNTMVRINTNKSSIPELLHKCAQVGRGHLWHPNKIHSEKAWTCLKMESSATKVWFGQSKRATLFEGTCFKILLLIFACFLETASQNCVGRWHSGSKDLEDRSC